jgi:lysophospholipase L1-like esterase
MGRHSYAIFIFQLFYFFVFGPMISEGLSIIGNPIVEKVFFILISIMVCVIPVLQFVDGLTRGTILLRIGAILMIIVCAITLVRWKWRPFYIPPVPFTPYEVKHHHDDTLRVIMIGDSWIYFHQTLRRDSTFAIELKRMLGSKKVKVTAKGKAGATSGEIYKRMSNDYTWEMDYDLNYSSQSVIEGGADYCVISAGINDARQRRGKNYYVGSYIRILRLLLSNGIRPVMMEIPNVEVDDAFEGNTLYYRLKARICMSALKTDLYGVGDYRRSLKDSLISTHLMDSIIYIPAVSWNPEGWRDKRDIYTDDHFHLNLLGYKILDSTFAAEIVKDYLKRKQ